MIREQINLVRESFAKVEPVAEEAAVLFYVRLFELDPALRPLFKNDIREQGLKLMLMIRFAVDGLERPEELFPAVRSLGARHAAYGVEDRHYETVGATLLWTLEEALKTDFTAEIKAAWTAVYSLLAENMKDAARREPEKFVRVQDRKA
jgi:hemoglobin-like flavoprotein